MTELIHIASTWLLIALGAAAFFVGMSSQKKIGIRTFGGAADPENTTRHEWEDAT